MTTLKEKFTSLGTFGQRKKSDFRTLTFFCLALCLMSFSGYYPVLAQQGDANAPEAEEEIDIENYRGPIKRFDKPTYKEDSPRIQFDRSDNIYDFGTIPQQSAKTLTAIVRNVGKSDLIIKEVRPDCGCTAVVLSSKTIPPGGQSEIQIIFDVGMRTGLQQKRVRIKSNDPVKKTSTLMIKALVEFVYNLDQTYVSFGTLTKNDLAVKKFVTIQTAPDESAEITEIQCDNPHLLIIEDKTDNAVKRLEVSLKDTLPIGLFTSSVTITTNNTKKPKASFKVSGNRLGVISMRPQTILFHLTKLQGSEKKAVSFAHLENKPVKIDKLVITKPDDFELIRQRIKRSHPEVKILEPHSSDLTWVLDKASTANDTRIILSFTRQLKENELVYGLVTFVTDDPEHKEVIAHFHGYRGNFNPLQQRRTRSDNSENDTDANRKNKRPSNQLSRP